MYSPTQIIDGLFSLVTKIILFARMCFYGRRYERRYRFTEKCRCVPPLSPSPYLTLPSCRSTPTLTADVEKQRILQYTEVYARINVPFGYTSSLVRAVRLCVSRSKVTAGIVGDRRGLSWDAWTKGSCGFIVVLRWS